MKNSIRFIWWEFLFVVLCNMFAVAANRYAVKSDDWNKPGTWSATSGGSSGASIPVAGDNVYIAEASFYTVIIPSGYAAACANLQIGSAGTSTNGYLSFSAASSSLTVSGNVDLYQPGDGWTREIDVWGGTLTINGNLSMNVGASSTISTRVTKVKVSTGTVTVGGNLVFNNVAGGSPLQNQLDLSVNTATFNLGGTFTITNNIGTLTPGTSSTFNFNGTPPQTIPIGVSSVVYNNLNVNNTNASGATLSAAISATNVTGNIAVQSGKFSNGGFAIVGNAAKSFTVSNGATFTLSGTSGMVTGFGTKTFGATSTVDYAGFNQTVSSESYGHLTTSGSGTKTAAGNLTIAGDLTVSAGTLDLSTFTANRSAPGGTLSVSNGATLKIGGTNSFPSNYTTRTLGATSTVEYGGSAQTVTNESYGHLTFSGSGTKTAAGAMTVNGNFTISTEPTFSAGSYSHIVKGDFSNSGTFDASTSTITFNGNSAEAISGSSTTTFNNLTLLNSNGLTLGVNTNVNGTLTLTSGNITTGSNTLILGSSSSVLGTLTHTSGTIVGTFKRWFAASTANNMLFPVGTTTNYRPANLSFTAAPSSAGTVASTFVASDPGSNGLPLDDAGFSVVNRGKTGYWVITSGDGLTGGTYSLDLTADGFENVQDYTTLRILKRVDSSSPWTLNGTHAAGTGSNQTPTAHRTGMSGFSEFGIGGGSGNPLRVQLAGFSGRTVGVSSVLLEWSTVSEVNNYGFYIQRRLENEDDFCDLPTSFVAGHGTTLEPQHYSFTDAAAGEGLWFYRLRQLDLDGSIHYSEPIRVDLVTGIEEHSIPSEFALEQNYPNPFNPTTVIQYSLPASVHVTLKLYNLLGQEVMTLVDERQGNGVKSVRLDASSLPSGVYLYGLTAGNFRNTKRLTLAK